MELSIVVEGTMFGSPGSMPGKSQSKVSMVGYAVHARGGIVSVLHILGWDLLLPIGCVNLR